MTSTIAPSPEWQKRAESITTLAMSSLFTPPASCSKSWTYEPQQANNVPSGLLLQNAAPSDGADPDCFPSGYSKFERTEPTIIYSPGYCPVGYTSATLAIRGPVTSAVCCLSDYKYYTEVRADDQTFAGCTSLFASDASTIVTVRQVSQESTQVVGPITMWAQPIQVQLEATDSSLFVTSTTTTNTHSSATVTPSSTTKSATTTSATPSSTDTGAKTESSGLSTGASIGIGVGVGMASLILVAALAFWLFRRHQSKKKLGVPETSPLYGSSGRPEASELGGSSADAATSYQRSGNTAASEVGGSSVAGTDSILANSRSTRFSELDGTSRGQKFVHELDA
ncbi:uncharacterized protein N7515_004337 [Penicillium bovifimosum]|uniref:Uncharacterized protein n=1 Tax=Penicillium bovifimosum TaxID=126998 RepID=A0A9W9L3X3_9EURO|nr:uncharacterized protein N7515_004337 [Penicillium bovifimosum]KAJ5135059.1 hypothetical protein N7515_004337 [Penicillium bovifimosum]